MGGAQQNRGTDLVHDQNDIRWQAEKVVRESSPRRLLGQKVEQTFSIQDVEIFLVGEKIKTHGPIQRPIDGGREPVKKRGHGVEFHGVPAVGCREEYASANTENISQKSTLCSGVAHVFDDRVTEDDVELAIPEWQWSVTVDLLVFYPRPELSKPVSRLEAC